MNEIVPQQLTLRQSIPTVVGCVDFTEFCDQMERFDKIIDATELDKQFVLDFINIAVKDARKKADKCGEVFKGFSYKKKIRLQNKGMIAFRCGIARTMTGESFRKFHIHLADSNVLQWFTRIDKVTHIRTFSKSQLERNEKCFTEEVLEETITTLLQASTDKSESLKMELDGPLKIDDVFIDSTCVETNIHHPVDWALFRDAIRTLMKATILIRKAGLKHRMDDPKSFIKKINNLSIEMGSARRKKDSKRERKRILRIMKKLLKKVENHGLRHRDLLVKHWEKTTLGKGKVDNILKGIDNVLMEIERVIFQAHERIIGERRISSDKKLLSLYEKETQIIVRGKLGAEVEFGNTLLLAEQHDGFIIDWDFFEGQSPSDAKLMNPSITRIQNRLRGKKIKSATADRGFWSPGNNNCLKKNNIKNFICSRSVPELRKQLQGKEFRNHQKRRGQTEGRIGIFKNCFLGRPLRSKGFSNRKMKIGLCVLTHNLWLLARLINENIKIKEKLEAA